MCRCALGRRRRILAMLRGGTAALRSETGRWSGLKRKERICRQCTAEEVEDVEHFLVRCEGWRQEREMVVKNMKGLVESPTTDDRNVALILDEACSNERVGRAVEKMWQPRLLQSPSAGSYVC